MSRGAFYGILIPFLGTSAGAACVLFMRSAMSEILRRILTGFAAGVMVAASVWSLLIPAIEQSEGMGVWSFVPAAVGFWMGILFLLLLDHVIPHLHQGSQEAEGPKTKLKKTTMLVLAVTLHNIPEGMAVSVPMAAGGERRWKAAALAALTGAPTVLGAALGYAVGAMSPAALAVVLSGASGAMLYVVFAELLPEAAELWQSRLPALAAVLGMIVGMAITLGQG